MFSIFNVSGSAISAQSQRLNVVASNLANADAVAGRRAHEEVALGHLDDRPSAAAGQTQDTPQFSIKFFCGLMRDSINIGPHGIAVHLKLKDLTAPAETLPAFSKWLNAAYTIVDEEAKNSSEDKPKPKLAGTVSQAAGGGSRSATSRSIPSCSELDKLYKGYVIPGSDTVAKICPYPHHAFNGGHGGHECYSAAKIVNSKENPFVRTHMSEAVYASLCAVVPKNA
jgi:hypothetical protein